VDARHQAGQGVLEANFGGKLSKEPAFNFPRTALHLAEDCQSKS
jgi:hypothetical protein